MNLYSIILPLIGYFLVEMFSFICFKNDFSQVYWLELCVKHIKWALILPILSKIKFVAKLNLACSLSGWFALSLFWDLGLSLNFSFIFFQTLIEISHAGKKKKKKVLIILLEMYMELSIWYYYLVESCIDHIMAWVGRNFKDDIVPTPLLCFEGYKALEQTTQRDQEIMFSWMLYCVTYCRELALAWELD